MIPQILFEDNHLVVAVKPQNMPSQADNSHDADFLNVIKRYVKEKYGKPYPMFCLSETKISGDEYMEELRAQFPGEDLDELIERYTDHRSEEEKRAELDALVDELVRRQNRHAP